ncbi:phosphotyrosyl phosphatase activator [Encephalitozoon intestinalis ATCC 50506]|uniref:Serine/threonine-protein phosphatase 2A activator n=1 Tax=Encephalitozoon intestinalis (strain ATCC 50506) TaxID=876142 RepID=E0S7J2_ENCIT|nr:phosphotyrosyl phosphatase activator [Encephalitozoon intestinalis ATCC 50506]ADM11671.1 phosphotyrosyl phosphatase activator [Encephalitozoon intestinalis ATCC 50506]UTX45408.1 serine/threonine-protein phosphatase 2A activator 2 [Encephalitozoon intestinalis]
MKDSTDFTETEAYSKIYNFILMVDDSIKNSEQRRSEHHMSILANIFEIVDSTEKDPSPQRYANMAAKTVFQRICGAYDDEHLKNSFGNQIRLDYGTGHELNFLCYLYTHHCRGDISLDCVFTTLVRYFEVVRLFVSKFNLEPAGSHGIWGLDDYQFLPFLFGSSELCNTRLRFDELNDSMCYFVAVKKKLGGTSQILNSIMDKDWPKVNRGMIRMYDDHVLRRSVVTQHFIYGEYLKKDRSLATKEL